MWHDIKHPRTGRLLFRFDPERDIIQVQDRGSKCTVDLSAYKQLFDLPDKYTQLLQMPRTPDEFQAAADRHKATTPMFLDADTQQLYRYEDGKWVRMVPDDT